MINPWWKFLPKKVNAKFLLKEIGLRMAFGTMGELLFAIEEDRNLKIALRIILVPLHFVLQV